MNIVIWGIGDISERFEQCLLPDIPVSAYVDSYAKKAFHNGIRIYHLDEFIESGLKYDYIVVASVYSNEIFESCLGKIDMEKLVFLRPFQSTEKIEIYYRNLSPLNNIAPAYKAEALLESGKKMGIDSQSEVILNCYPAYDYDYFRYRTFELIADQLADKKGDVAEVGVFRGDFAKIINTKFPNDMFYLFDTFEGFNEIEAVKEFNAGNCSKKFINEFKNTSINLVLEKMTYKDNCIIKKGLFPKTTEGIETEFKFVSVDVDFEDSIFLAVDWFYKRLVKGGIIFVHDYNEPKLKGVKKAIERLEQKYGTFIKIPIADKCGTLIITK